MWYMQKELYAKPQTNHNLEQVFEYQWCHPLKYYSPINRVRPPYIYKISVAKFFTSIKGPYLDCNKFSKNQSMKLLVYQEGIKSGL